MELSTILPYIVLAIVVITAIYLIRGWIIIYNKFQYWREKAKKTFANIEIVMQERLDRLEAIAQTVKKYDIHEYKALKDVIEARSKVGEGKDLDERVENTSKVEDKIENSLMKLNAVFEQYPQLKSELLHEDLLEQVSHVESRLRKARKKYNRVVRKYNFRTRRFPRNLVASNHGFEPLEYLKFKEQESYLPEEILSG